MVRDQWTDILNIGYEQAFRLVAQGQHPDDIMHTVRDDLVAQLTDKLSILRNTLDHDISSTTRDYARHGLTVVPVLQIKESGGLVAERNGPQLFVDQDGRYHRFELYCWIDTEKKMHAYSIRHYTGAYLVCQENLRCIPGTAIYQDHAGRQPDHEAIIFHAPYANRDEQALNAFWSDPWSYLTAAIL